MKRLFYTILSIFFSLFVTAQEDITTLKKEYYSTNSSIDKSTILFKISDYYLTSHKNTDSAFAYINKLEKNASIITDSLQTAEVLYRKAKAHYLSSNYEKTKSISKKALSVFEKFNAKDRAALVYVLLGHTHQVLFQNQEAIGYFLKAEQSALEKDKIQIYVGLGAVNTQANNLDKSIDYYNKAFNLSSKLNDRKYLYNIHNGFASIYLKEDEIEKVFESLNKALEEAKKSKDFLAQVVCHHNIGYNHLLIKNFTEAQTSFELAITLFNNISNKYMMGAVYMHYSEALMNSNNLEQADNNLAKAEQIFKDIKNTGRLPKILNIRAQIEQKKGNLQESITLLNSAIKLSKANEITGITQKNYFELSKAYEASGNKTEALEAFKRYNAISDSINLKKQRQEIAKMQTKFDLAEYEQDLKVSNQKRALLEQEKKTSNYRNILLAVVAIGLLLFIYWQRNINKEKQKRLETEKELMILKEKELHSEVQFKNTEITSFALHISERNKLLQSLNGKIKNIKKEASSSVKLSLAELQMYIKDHIEVNKEKVLLNSKAKETQDSFVLKLKENNTLTPKEIQVATYLRLNLPSKQIATQMSIAEQSVNNYRRSIRKKFNLEKDDNLTDFLNKLS